MYGIQTQSLTQGELTAQLLKRAAQYDTVNTARRTFSAEAFVTLMYQATYHTLLEVDRCQSEKFNRLSDLSAVIRYFDGCVNCAIAERRETNQPYAACAA
jgi:hypothetical protein